MSNAIITRYASSFERSAVEAALKFKYKPRVIDGDPVASHACAISSLSYLRTKRNSLRPLTAVRGAPSAPRTADFLQ